MSAICKKQDNQTICSYLNNAKLSQNTTNLQAQQIIIYKTNNGKIEKVIASGNNPHYSGTDSDNHPIDAHADSITIYPEKDLFILEDKAQIISEKNNLQAKQITIQKVNNKVDKITASGDRPNYSGIDGDNTPVKANADLITIFPIKNTYVLEGKAQVTIENNEHNPQKTSNLQAHRITIHRAPNNKVDKIVASGDHPHYSGTNKDNAPTVASADLMTIYPITNMLILEGNGKIITGPDKYSGPHIEYQFK